MDASFGLRVGMIFTGAALLCATLSSLAKRRMTDSFVLNWGLISMIFVVAGVFLHPVELERYISGMGMLLVAAVGFCMVFGAYFMSERISELMRRNLELTMQMALLQQEVKTLETRVSDHTEEGLGHEKKDAAGYQYTRSGRG